MTPSDVAAARASAIKEADEIENATVPMRRFALVQALNIAADVMQNSAAVAKSEAWKNHYRVAMKEYRDTANMIAGGAKLSLK